VKVEIERHLTMLFKNHTDSCIPGQNITPKNLQTCSRRKESGTPPLEPAAPLPGKPPLCRMPHLPRMPPLPRMPHLPRMPPLPRTPPAPPDDRDWHESYEIEGMPSSCVYIHSPLPNTQFFNHNAYTKVSQHDKYFVELIGSTNITMPRTMM